MVYITHNTDECIITDFESNQNSLKETYSLLRQNIILFQKYY